MKTDCDEQELSCLIVIMVNVYSQSNPILLIVEFLHKYVIM